MSFILTVYLRNRILMTANNKPAFLHWLVRRLRAPNRNMFLLSGRVGVSVCGQETIEGKPAIRYVQLLLKQQLCENEPEVDETARFLFRYFSVMEPVPNLSFHVAGYKGESHQAEQRIWFIDPPQGVLKRLNAEGVSGMAWNSSYAVLTREAISIKSLTDILAISPGRAGWVDKQSIRERMSKIDID